VKIRGALDKIESPFRSRDRVTPKLDKLPSTTEATHLEERPTWRNDTSRPKLFRRTRVDLPPSPLLSEPVRLRVLGLTLYIASRQYSCMAINTQSDHLSLAFAALADPTRRAILVRLASGDADVSELMKPFALRQPTISKHLNVLERAGLVRCTRDAQRRPRTLVAVPLKDIADWLEPFRRFWEQKFASLDNYLKEMQKKEKTRGCTKR
jgi:DNA-binding transcriptional ArsR family regulator